MIASLFVLKLSAGIALMWWLMPRKDVTDGFFRIQMRVLLGLAVLGALLFSAAPEPSPGQAGNSAVSGESPATVADVDTWANHQATIRNICISVAVIAYAGSVFWALGRRRPGNICIHLLLLLCCGALCLHSLNVGNKSSVAEQLLSDFSSAAVLGGVLTGMLLGHWYLTTPSMSIQPLLWFNVAILVTVGLRLLASSWAVVQFGSTQETTQQIWLGMRWAGGIVAPAATTLLVWRIMKHRNTQSATGVLFAGLILVFMGEMTAILLEQATRVAY